MTALNIFVQRERAWLITDAAWYDLNGVLRFIAPKSQVVGHWPGAIATRGPGLANSIIATEAGMAFADFDAFADGASAFLRDWCARNADNLAQWQEQAHVEVVAIGWSKRLDRARGIFVTSKDDAAEAAAREMVAGEDGRLEKPFEVFEIETGYLRPQPSAEAMKAYGVDPDIDLEGQLSLSGLGTRIIMAQRELREPIIPGGDPVCFVGGFAMITHVDKAGATMSKGVAFPDEIGSRIDAKPHDGFWPHDDEGTPAPTTPPPGMSRQQRRAWEAQQRKRGGGRVRAVS